MRTNHFIVRSLELHLFFCRIMKEHALFLRAGFMPADPDFSETAEFYLDQFEGLLRQAVELAQGIVSEDVLKSGEVVTEFTCLAEKQTMELTGIPIDSRITKRSEELKGGKERKPVSRELHRKVHRLNRTALKLLDGLIEFKENILENVACGSQFTGNYPLLIEHILREAKLYRKYVRMLENTGRLSMDTMKEAESFWNQIMMEHAMFIRGLLDPCETELMDTADGFAKEFCALLEASRKAQDRTLTEKTLKQTQALRDFKAAGTKGIQECKIRSVILPLLADHVLREANHYIRLLK